MASSNPHGPEFWKVWGDGMAEMNGYDLTYPRYGQLRKGSAVAIFVTETFSKSARVKSEPGRHSRADEFPVMKLNLVRDYQTGVYDYNDMVSVFAALADVDGRPYGLPTKVSFTSQEWCGHVYSHVLFGRERAWHVSHSYFDGEADSARDIPFEGPASSEDALWLWARGIVPPYNGPGPARKYPMLSSLETARAKHVPLQVVAVELSTDVKSQVVRVPAGQFEAQVRTARLSDGVVRRYFVEKAAPHRLLKWEASSGERAELLGSSRMKYWEMNREGGEQALKQMGLSRRGPHMS
jgi:hypothetical protein